MSVRDDIQSLAEDIHAYVLRHGFHSGDDIPRVPREPDWVPAFTPESVEERLAALAPLYERWRAIDAADEPVEVQVDHRLLGSALNRHRWDLEVTRNWERNAVFLVGQVLGPWYDLLLPLPPFGKARQQALVEILAGMPERVELVRANLDRAGVADLARAAVVELADIDTRLATAVEALGTEVGPETLDALRAALVPASEALLGLRSWLEREADRMAPSEPVGRDRFVWYLRNVALIAQEPEELARAAMQDYRRAVVWEKLTANRFRDVPEAPLAESIEAQVALEARQEADVRAFYEREGLLTQPDTLQRYHVAAMPAYVAALRSQGVPDDLTDEFRLDSDAVSYMPEPQPELPYFYAANARDPRLGIIHEGAHYKQLAMSWAHPDPVRRRYYDSVANEGIAHYNEEMMLMAGLFEDAPHSQTIVHNFTRLRALRVIADVNLATGAFTLDEAIDHFVSLVPMDVETAREESAMYIATPGLAMSYHVGKQQMLALVTDAIVAQGEEFSFRALHDAVWSNGNVPFSLLRWELLGDRSEVDILDAAASEL